MLEIIGRTDIPVFAGATYPLLNSQEATKRGEAIHGKLFYKGAWMEEWPKEVLVHRAPSHAAEFLPEMVEGVATTSPATESASAFLLRTVREFPGEVSILAMGPCTNLALAIRLDDSFVENARELVVMGGSFNPHPADNAFALEYAYTPRLEFNFRWDPEAASITLRAPWKKITQVPIDPSTRTLFTKEMIAQLATVDTPLARYVSRHVQSFPLWDEIAAAVWLFPALITKHDTLEVDVDTGRDSAGYGNTLSWPKGKGPGLGQRAVDVVFEVDAPRLEKWVLDLLSRPATPPN